ncbi:threonine/serine exporter family protein [Rhodopila sp.]|uniref:threonine/serine exporter family protein n=1 Tax=Rhodopila sp. TaxID=2480087 RepID=UPI003D0CFE26
MAISTVLDLTRLAATLLFVNGQTTQRTIEAAERLAGMLGFRASLLPRWGELHLRIDDGTEARAESFAADPVGVDMGKVAATLSVIDQLGDGRLDIAAARSALQAIGRRPPIGLARFAALAGAGAAALGVIFGAAYLLSLVLIALSAAAGACLRRGIAGISHNAFVQPFCAALLAGVAGAVAVDLQVSSMLRLIAVCPCMILVPGPHLLNGTMDLARARIALGASRIGFASLSIVMICTGLLVGLSLGGVTLPVSGQSDPVPVLYDVIAAGVAVAAYGTFFAMPWRMLPVPMLIGMAAHAARWATISLAGGSVEAGALVACLLVGTIVTPVADRLRLPFAAFAFAAVVSLIPGVFLFRLGGGLVDLATLGAKASPDLLLGTIADGATAMLIILAMAFGLIVPKLFIEHFYPGLAGPPRPDPG